MQLPFEERQDNESLLKTGIDGLQGMSQQGLLVSRQFADIACGLDKTVCVTELAKRRVSSKISHMMM